MEKLKLMASVTLLTCAGCLPAQRRMETTSQVESLDLTTTIDVEDIAKTLSEIFFDIDPADLDAQLALTPMTDYWRSLDQLDSKGKLQFRTKTLDLSESEIITRRTKKAAMRPRVAQQITNLKDYASITSTEIDSDCIAQSFIRLAALVSADPSLTDNTSLYLTAPHAKLGDIKELAQIGRDIYEQPVKAIGHSINRDTWELIQRNRATIGMGLALATKLRPNHPKIKKYAKVIRGVMLASDFMMKRFEGADFLPKEVTVWD